MANDYEKQVAARESLRFIENGQVVGLGSGSTAAFFIQLLGERVKDGLKVRAIPTSTASHDLAAKLGIPLATLAECPQIDVAVDGADEIDPQLRAIKGGGGALLREKIIASAARRFVIIVDSTKQVATLGKFPLPVEVVPFAEPVVAKRIGELGASVRLRAVAGGGPFVTDEGHHILDCDFGRIADPEGLARQLGEMPGVVEHGLFINMASVAIIGRGERAVELKTEAT